MRVRSPATRPRRRPSVKRSNDAVIGGGGTDCKVLYTCYNQCCASIRSGRPDNGTMLNAGAYKEQALERATQDCRNSGSQECTFVHSDCTKPFFQEG